MAHAAALLVDNANLSDTRYPDTTGADVWDDLLAVEITPLAEDSVIGIDLLLVWFTLVRSGNDPYLQYRVVGEVGSVEAELLAPETLDESVAAARSPLPVKLIDVPGTTETVTYKLQVRGVGYATTVDNTFWVPPVTTTGTASAGPFSLGTGPQYPSPPAGCTATGYSTSGGVHDFYYHTDYECTTPGYWAGSVGTTYVSSSGHVGFRAGTSLYAHEGIDTILEEEE